MKVLIVGGVAGGASAAARLRRLDETAEIIILERGDYVSFANCGLPYFIGGEITDKQALTLQRPESFGRDLTLTCACEMRLRRSMRRKRRLPFGIWKQMRNTRRAMIS